jgi:hypothetical protein
MSRPAILWRAGPGESLRRLPVVGALAFALWVALAVAGRMTQRRLSGQSGQAGQAGEAVAPA